MDCSPYDPSLRTDRDWVRFFIADKGPTFYVADEEIDALLVEQPNKYLAASVAGRLLINRTAGATGGMELIEKQVDGLRLRYGGGSGGSEGGSSYASHLDWLWREGCNRLYPTPKLITVL